ncbi:MAG: caspase family protein [Solirubrobacterales bacterium]
MPTTTERAAGRRLALVVATAAYADPTLAKLRAPGRDATDLAAVLEDAAVGGFEVEMVLDAPAELMRRRIAQFCGQTGPNDLALVYLSCHGVLDDRGRLYYATGDTDRGLLSATGVSAAWLNEQLEDCRCRRQILVLDCCHSGAFAKGAKGESDLALRERFEGRGRIVLTGSRGTEYSFEHEGVIGDSVSSVFTNALVEGLRSGEADRDGDGMITVSELYDYAYEAVRAKEARQTPTLWSYGAEGDLLVAHSPRGAIVEPAPLPEDLLILLESARSRVREGAVAELADLLAGADAGRTLTARAELERIATEDIPNVAAAARAALDGAPDTAEPNLRPPAAPTPPSRVPPPPPSPLRHPKPEDPSPPNRRRAVAIGAGAIVAALIAVAVLTMGGGEGDSFPPPPPGPEIAGNKIDVNGSPHGIAVGEEAIWVALHDRGQVEKIGSSSKPKRKPIHVGPKPGKIVAGDDAVWVSFKEGQWLARIDPQTDKVEKKFPVDTPECECPITDLAIAHHELWVSSKDKQSITRRNLDSGEKLGKPLFPGDDFEGVFAVGEDAVWALENSEGEASSVTRIDLDSKEAEPDFYRERDSYFEAVAYGAGMVWIANSGNDRILAIDPETGDLVKSTWLEDGIFDDEIAVAGEAVIVWNPDGGWLTRIDAGTMKLVGPKPIPGFPVADTDEKRNELRLSDLAVDDDTAWVTNPEDKTVHRFEYRPTSGR